MKKMIISLGVLLSVTLLALPLAQPAYAYSVNDSKSQVCKGLSETIGASNCKNGGGKATLNSTINTVVKWFSIIVGVIAVIMIIVAGLKFITSGGDANSVAAAKKALIYAIIGIAIVALAQIIVHFVINQAGETTSSSQSAPSPPRGGGGVVDRPV